MKLTLNRKNLLLIVDAPSEAWPMMRKWFGVRRSKTTPNVWMLPERQVWAFIGFYPTLEVEPEVTGYLRERFSRNAIVQRIKPHLKSWKGGYQAQIVSWAIDQRHHLIASKFGSGKTVMVCEWARLIGPIVLIVDPLIWENAYVNDAIDPETGEVEGDLLRFYPELRYATCMGKSKEERLQELSQPADIYAISPHVIGGMMEALDNVPIAGVAVEEVAILRGTSEKLMPVRFHKACELRQRAKFSIGVSADLTPNSVGDLWGPVEFVQPGLLGSRSDFESKYGERSNWGYHFPDRDKAVQAVEEINETRLISFLDTEEFWPESKDIPLEIKKVPVDLVGSQAEAYNSMKENMRLRIDDKDFNTGRDQTKTMWLRQITAGFIYDKRKRPTQVSKFPAKLRKLAQIVSSPNGCAGEQAMIWVYFEWEYEAYANLLESMGLSHGILRGRDSSSIRAMREFSHRRIQFLITHPESAGHSLRFPNNHNAIYTSYDYKAEPFNQSLYRFWRPPQTHPCRVWLLVGRNTVDEVIVDILEGKADQRQLVEATLKKTRLPINVDNRRRDEARKPRQQPQARDRRRQQQRQRQRTGGHEGRVPRDRDRRREAARRRHGA